VISSVRRWNEFLLKSGLTLARQILPPSIKDRVPARFRRAAGRNLDRQKSTALTLDDKLWGGYSRSATADLGALLADPTATAAVRASAALSLARWKAVHGDHVEALALTRRSRALAPGRPATSLEAQCLISLGRTEEARRLLVEQQPGRRDATHQLLLANCWNNGAGAGGDPEAPTRCLEAVNAVFRRHGLCDVRLREAEIGLSLDNMEGHGFEPVDDPRHAVTVIMPAHNAAPTIATALRALADQSWRALSVIVVDDCSTDNTLDVARTFCRTDPRFTVMQTSRNSGSYEARNLALARTETPFVTVHDADDWSHPQKIERQVRALARSSAPYNYTMLCRARSDLVFVSGTRPTSRLVGPNHSAGLFRTDALRSAGGWDEVRISGDTELFWRLEAIQGRTQAHSRNRRLLPDCPLSFARDLDQSLSKASATNALTMFHGVRREYREAAAFWHRRAGRTDSATRPATVAPWSIRVHRESPARCDLFIAADFTALDWSARQALEIAEIAAENGLDVAILQYAGYGSNVTQPLPDPVRVAAGKAGIRIVAPGEETPARLALVARPDLFQHRLDRFPEVAPDRALILVDRLPGTGEFNGTDHFDPATVSRNAAGAFGCEPEWVPVSGLAAGAIDDIAGFDRTRVRAHWPAVARPPSGGSARRNGRWKRAGRPVVGHAGAARIGRLDRHWRKMDPAAGDLPGQLADLDLFLHFPDRDEPTMLPAILAMSVGVPVVADARCRSDLGEAAFYAEEDDVQLLVTRLWHDEAMRTARVDRARELLARSHGPRALMARLARAGLATARQRTASTAPHDDSEGMN